MLQSKKLYPPPAAQWKIAPKRPAMEPLPVETNAKTPRVLENFDTTNPPVLPLEPNFNIDDPLEGMTVQDMLQILDSDKSPSIPDDNIEIHEKVVACTQSNKENTQIQQMEWQISVKCTSPNLPPTYVFNNCKIENLHLHVHKNWTQQKKRELNKQTELNMELNWNKKNEWNTELAWWNWTLLFSLNSLLDNLSMDMSLAYLQKK